MELTPEQYFDETLRLRAVAQKTGIAESDITHIEIRRSSLDSRRGVHYRVRADVYVAPEGYTEEPIVSPYRDCSNCAEVVIVGAGPAGMFAALRALEVGLRPVVVERGEAVQQRSKDITAMVHSGHVNPNSNWCFGEGGAGTYSDGKLFTRSTKRGNVQEVLRKFVEHGADNKILIETHAHIGTDRLHSIVSNIRHTVEQHGGEYHFGSQVDDLVVRNGAACGVHCNDGATYTGVAVVLATGHSARDIFDLFERRKLTLQAKPFAVGVRVEHPQALINEIQYHGRDHSPLLPPATYSLTTQVDGHGVFSFCMCPGGVIVPAATADGEQVVNGMSNASRSSAFANSGIAVTVSPADIGADATDAMSMLRFQRSIEQAACHASGGGLTAPAQSMTDFCRGKTTVTLRRTNYMGKCCTAPLHEVLPPFVVSCLQRAFKDYDRKMRGFYTAEATLLAVESRTSSPVRIPRTVQGEQIDLPGLYPCGEGAGYAGGITSSALDGINTIDCIARKMGLLESSLANQR